MKLSRGSHPPGEGKPDASLPKYPRAATIRNMRCIDIKALKNNLSEYVQLVAEGETVLICDHGRVVAELCPARIQRRAEIQSEALLMDAVREGLVTPALLASGRPPTVVAPKMTLEHLLHTLDEERSEC